MTEPDDRPSLDRVAALCREAQAHLPPSIPFRLRILLQMLLLELDERSADHDEPPPATAHDHPGSE